MKYGLFCSKFSTDHFSEDQKNLSGPTYAKISKNCRKFDKNRPLLRLKFLETGTEIEKTLQSNPAVLFGDSKTPFGLILSLMGFSKKCTL